MHFPDFKANAEISSFSADHFSLAQKYLPHVLRHYYPEWLKNPKGLVGTLWKNPTQHNAEVLTDLGIRFHQYLTNLSPDSAPAARHKIRGLFDCKDPKQLEEQIAELSIGGVLGHINGPLAVDPLSRPLTYQSAAPPRSPDYSTNIGQCEIFCETTVLRMNAIDQWKMHTDIVRERLMKKLPRQKLYSAVEIHAPLSIRSDQFSDRMAQDLANEMRKTGSGQTMIGIGQTPVFFKWEALPIHHFNDEDEWLSLIKNNRMVVAHNGDPNNPGISGQTAVAVTPILDPSFIEKLEQSIKNTLDGKRGQFCGKAPTMLIVQPSMHFVKPELILEIAEHFFNIDLFGWLNALALFVPGKSFSKNCRLACILPIKNPKSKNSCPPELAELIRRLIE